MYRAPLPTLPKQTLSQHNLNKLDVQLRKWREASMVSHCRSGHWPNACVMVAHKFSSWLQFPVKIHCTCAVHVMQVICIVRVRIYQRKNEFISLGLFRKSYFLVSMSFNRLRSGSQFCCWRMWRKSFSNSLRWFLRLELYLKETGTLARYVRALQVQ